MVEQDMPELPCQIPALGLGCFGCCGRSYGNKRSVLSGIRKNTAAWLDEQEKKPANRLSLRDFCWRQYALRSCGVCVNVIEEQGAFVCVVHPARHGGEDVRKKYCDTQFLCDAAKAYTNMNDAEKKKYLAFLKRKVRDGMDSYAYSRLNDKEALIKEFLQSRAT